MTGSGRVPGDSVTLDNSGEYFSHASSCTGFEAAPRSALVDESGHETGGMR